MKYMFMLGGADAEMMAIRELLEGVGAEYVDHQLGWGAKVDSYKEEIEEALAVGKMPVCIELQGAAATYGDEVVVVDHHSYGDIDYTDCPASILQVCNLLGIEPDRHQLLIAANDSGYIPGMLAMGATSEEVAEIRRLDRAAQGITPEQEAEAERALQAREHIGCATVVRMAHSKCATVTDALFGSKDADSLLVVCDDGERDYFGDGIVCAALKEAYPDGWAGGDGYGKAGGSAFFGCYGTSEEELLAVINNR
jgi:hypothetical protein